MTKFELIAQMAATLAAGDSQARYTENLGLDVECHARQAVDLYNAVDRLLKDEPSDLCPECQRLRPFHGNNCSRVAQQFESMVRP